MKTIVIIGLGYVGLPLAVELSKKFAVFGYDINAKRINDLKNCIDITGEANKDQLSKTRCIFSTEENVLGEANVFIITVPTPIDKNKNPDLSNLIAATELVGRYLKPGDLVVFESTVFPGATEEICVPILETKSEFLVNQDFLVAYSPERVNPSDPSHKIRDVVKVVSGSCSKALKEAAKIYGEIVTAGIYQAESIKVAEAAKVIENVQRDVNIGLVNELSKLFFLLGINTHQVLNAAATKWNFQKFTPGLVGGHCIGVDPFYLTYKAQEVGYHPEIVLAGRRMNDSMAGYVALRVSQSLAKQKLLTQDTNVLIMGASFKENCPDLRNTKVWDLCTELQNFGTKVEIFDPIIDKSEAKLLSNIAFLDFPVKNKYHAIIIAVPHNEFIAFGLEEIKAFGKQDAVIFDLKQCFEFEAQNVLSL